MIKFRYKRKEPGDGSSTLPPKPVTTRAQTIQNKSPTSQKTGSITELKKSAIISGLKKNGIVSSAMKCGSTNSLQKSPSAKNLEPTQGLHKVGSTGSLPRSGRCTPVSPVIENGKTLPKPPRVMVQKTSTLPKNSSVSAMQKQSLSVLMTDLVPSRENLAISQDPGTRKNNTLPRMKSEKTIEHNLPAPQPIEKSETSKSYEVSYN